LLSLTDNVLLHPFILFMLPFFVYVLLESSDMQRLSKEEILT
jgi:hypothetical protein